MKKKTLLIPLIIVIIILGYIGLKLYYLNYYSTKNIDLEYLEGLNINDKITLSKEKTEDYLTFDNIKIKNEFKDFKPLEQQSTKDSKKYGLYNESNELIAAFSLGTTTSYIEMIKSDIAYMFDGDNNYKNISNTTLKNIIKNNNITNDIELFKYLKDINNKTNNLFTPIISLKERYAINLVSSVIIPKLNDITQIEGIYEGYIMNLNDNKIHEVRITNNDKTYALVFFNLKEEYFTKEDINRLLNTVEFN